MSFAVLVSAVRGNMQFLTACGAGVLYVANVYPQVWGIRRYMEVVQFYKDGRAVPLDKDCERMGQEILDKMKLDPLSESNIRFFHVYGQDPLNKGSSSTRDGGIVGIPITFSYKSPDDVETSKIMLNDISIDWESEAGLALKDSLILSENAKRFVIARELMTLNTYHVHLRALSLVGCYTVAYTLGFAFNKITNFPKRAPLPARLFAYSIFGGIGLALYVLNVDSFNSSSDASADLRAAQLGREYAEGGVEFYNKTLQRNVALRTLLKDGGQTRYTAYGNDAHSWRSPHLPLTTRRDNMTAALQKYSSETRDEMKDSESI